MFRNAQLLPFAGHEVLSVSSFEQYQHARGHLDRVPAIRPMFDGVPFEACVRRRVFDDAALEVAMISAAGAYVAPATRLGRITTLLPVSGAGLARSSHGSAQLCATQQAAVFGGQDETELSLGPGWIDLCLEIELQVFQAAYRAWTGCDAPVLFRGNEAFALDQPMARRLWDLTGSLFRAADEEGTDPLIDPLLERWALGLMRVVGPLRVDDAQPEALPSVRHVRAAEEFMRANLAVPLRMQDLANELGVGVRALQKAFVRWRGRGPLQTLNALRLQYARELLLQDAVPTVTDAAIQAGCRHLGRFSVAYRERFGESPSLTRRRGRPLVLATSSELAIV